jgi:hypothetical protein
MYSHTFIRQNSQIYIASDTAFLSHPTPKYAMNNRYSSWKFSYLEAAIIFVATLYVTMVFLSLPAIASLTPGFTDLARFMMATIIATIPVMIAVIATESNTASPVPVYLRAERRE